MNINRKIKLVTISLLLSVLSMGCEAFIRGVDGAAVVTATPTPIPVTYTANPATYLSGQKLIVSNYPIVNNGKTATSYAINPALPAGLSFNTTNGIIYSTGTTTLNVTASATYTITVTFSDATTADIPIVVEIAGSNRCS